MGTAIPQFRARGHQPRTGPGPVAVAFLGRTSTATAQDPVESLAKQLRLARERLPEGFCITRYYWDVESGGIDLDARSRTVIWQDFASAGIPRDGGMADMRAAVAAGNPPFTAAICENIERAGRDMYDALRPERELGTAGIPIFATDEPIDADASQGSTLLVRRTKQGVAEYFRYNLKTQMWEGLRQYVIGGFNTGKTPYGYLADRTIHPNPMKASMGATRARLVPDPERGPWVTRIYQWRVWEKLSVPGIARRLTELGAPSPDGGAWSPSTVDTILHNPKYTGRVVLGRTTNTGPTMRKGERKVRHLPREYWTWADEANAHPALVGLELWEAAQATGRQRGNVRDPGTPGRPGSRRYPYRARIRCRQCKRRMHGITRPGRRPGQPQVYTYYVCPTQAANPRDAQDHPGHIRASVPEPAFTAALSDCLDKYALGYDRAAMLAELIPATAAQQHDHDRARAEQLRRQLAQAQTAIKALIAQVEKLGASTRPADIAYCDRLREQFSARHDEQTAIEAELQAIEDIQPVTDDDITLIDELPYAPELLARAPDCQREAIAAAFDMQATYRPDLKQATVILTITDATPGIISALLADPRTDSDTAADTSATFADLPPAATATRIALTSRCPALLAEAAGPVR